MSLIQLSERDFPGNGKSAGSANFSGYLVVSRLVRPDAKFFIRFHHILFRRYRNPSRRNIDSAELERPVSECLPIKRRKAWSLTTTATTTTTASEGKT